MLKYIILYDTNIKDLVNDINVKAIDGYVLCGAIENIVFSPHSHSYYATMVIDEKEIEEPEIK